jgi:lipid-A-disaccharide synthase
MQMDSLRVAMVAGETSGDMLAAHLIAAMRSRWPALQASGIGGVNMAAQGLDAWWPSEKLAVRGYVEVLRHYRAIVAIRRELIARLRAAPPDLFMGVDAPDFNLDVAWAMRQSGVKTMHFISPSVWAWRAERMNKIKAAVDHVLCIFPFEPAIYAAHGMAATFVGHPLAQVIPMHVDKAAARSRLGLLDHQTVIAVLPGSRQSEVQYIAHKLFLAVAHIRRALPAVQFIVPAVPGLRTAIQAQALRAGVSDYIQILDGQSHTALAACDLTLIASGTATLEAALFKRPMVIAYNMHWLSWQIMRRKKYQPWVGLPNILCQDFVVPELIQGEATPQALAREALRWLDEHARVKRLEERFVELHLSLQRDTLTLATDAIAQVLAR